MINCRKNLAGPSCENDSKRLNFHQDLSERNVYGLIQSPDTFSALAINALRRIKMKKYGQADIMCALVHIFIERQDKLTDEQKKKIENKCCEKITSEYPTAAEWELEK